MDSNKRAGGEQMNILSFGGGVQTTALAILASQGQVKVDAAIFADPGGEKPETYWYMEAYIKPLFEEVGIPFKIIGGRKDGRNLVEHCHHFRVIPSVVPKWRWCTASFKAVPIVKAIAADAMMLIGFSSDEAKRAENARLAERKRYPLIELNLTGADCRNIISSYGWPIPVKSSCIFCPLQHWSEWNWLKAKHPEVIEKDLAIEARFYERRPDLRETRGLFGGAPLWKYVQGVQMEMPLLNEYSCWSGACGH